MVGKHGRPHLIGSGRPALQMALNRVKQTVQHGVPQPPTVQQLGLNLEDDVTLPVILVNDGRVIRQNLTACGRDENWLYQQLTQQKVSSPREVFLLTLDEQGRVFCIKKEAVT